MQVCSVVAGKTAPRASGMPLRPSVTAIRISATPRVFRSLKTFIQNLAPSVFSIQMPRISRVPSGNTPNARYTALLRTTASSLGIREIEEKIWLVSFMHYDLGFFDHETGRVECADNPFEAKVLPMPSARTKS